MIHSWKVASIGVTGVALALGAAVVRVPEAGLHLSGKAEACLACHRMAPQHASWKASAHARVTTCEDCHLPQEGLAEALAHKASDGLRHAAVTFVAAEPEAIRLGEAGLAVVQANCVRCHGWGAQPPTTPAGAGLPRPQPTPRDAVHADPARPCAGCHRETPHGRASATTLKPA